MTWQARRQLSVNNYYPIRERREERREEGRGERRGERREESRGERRGEERGKERRGKERGEGRGERGERRVWKVGHGRTTNNSRPIICKHTSYHEVSQAQFWVLPWQFWHMFGQFGKGNLKPTNQRITDTTLNILRHINFVF